MRAFSFDKDVDFLLRSLGLQGAILNHSIKNEYYIRTDTTGMSIELLKIKIDYINDISKVFYFSDIKIEKNKITLKIDRQ
jgi:hypothetical protein